jgi:SAM-dependent methyltransferase
MDNQESYPLACPACHTELEHAAPGELVCPADGQHFRRVDGIWRMLLPDRQPFFSQFMREYEAIRKAEERGSNDPAYYQALPYRDLSGRMQADWQIRAASFDAFIKQVLSPIEKRSKRPLRVADIGAGNGWLSARVASRKHSVIAIDLATNDFDGLGCFRHYASPFTPVQAEFDHLPFLDRSLDLIVFNASFHYSLGYGSTLTESLRVLDTDGKIVVMDSPVYQDEVSGKQMIKEREELFTNRYGFPSNSLPTESFITYACLEELARKFNLSRETITPFYNLSWLLRPFKARLLGSREPAKFHLLVLKRSGSGHND